MLGTLRYMSPEQALAKRGYLDHRTDIYSLGATLYELLTLRPAIDGQDRQQVLRKIAQDEPAPPRKLNASIPRELETILLKAMTKEPASRYATAQELADDLDRFLEHKPIKAKRPNLLERASKWARRHRGLVASAAVMLMLAMAGLAIATILIEHQRQRALTNLRTANEQRDLVAARSRELAAAYKAQERQLYISLVNRAHAEWSANNIALAEQLLDECPQDRRGWEWYHCRRLCRLERLTLRSPGQSMISLAFSRDGRWIITAANAHPGGEGPGEWTIWDATTGRAIESRRMEKVRVVAEDPAGTMVAVGANGGERNPAAVSLWRNPTEWPLRLAREPALVLRIRHGGLAQLAFSPDGRRLVTSSSGWPSALELWEVGQGQKLKAVELGGDKASLAFRPDGKQLAAGLLDGTIELRDATTCEVTRVLRGHKGNVYSVVYSADGRRLVSCGWDKTVRVWVVASGNPIHVLRGHDSFVRAVAINPDGTRIASASEDNTVRLWDATSGEGAGMLRGHSRFVLDVAFSPDGRRIASASEDGTVKLWDASAAGPARTLTHANWVPSLAFLPDGSTVASACWDGTIRFWDAAEGREIRSIRCHPNIMLISMALPADGTAIAESDDRGRIRLWDIATGQLLRVLAGHHGYCFGVAFRPDGRQLASTGQDGTLRLWNCDTGQSLTIAKPPSGVESIAVVYSPDGRQVAAAFTDGPVRVFLRLPPERSSFG
jgi:WD40 repeat protein